MKINSIIKGVMAASIAGVMALTANIALADYPDKDITFIVPYSPCLLYTSDAADE